MISKEQRETKFRHYFAISFIIIIISILSTIIVLYIVTRNAIFPNFSFNSETGTIGDTIGGVGNVIVGIIGAILMYITIHIQIITNRLTFNRIEIDAKSNQKSFQRNELSLRIEGIKHAFWLIGANKNQEDNNTPNIVYELDAIEFFINNPNHKDFKVFLIRYTIALDKYLSYLKITRSINLDLEDKEYFYNEGLFVFDYYIKEQAIAFISNDSESVFLIRLNKLYEEICNEIKFQTCGNKV
jgi:hypothetical protein